jgi:hypothetical protein
MFEKEGQLMRTGAIRQPDTLPRSEGKVKRGRVITKK